MLVVLAGEQHGKFFSFLQTLVNTRDPFNDNRCSVFAGFFGAFQQHIIFGFGQPDFKPPCFWCCSRSPHVRVGCLFYIHSRYRLQQCFTCLFAFSSHRTAGRAAASAALVFWDLGYGLVLRFVICSLCPLADSRPFLQIFLKS